MFPVVAFITSISLVSSLQISHLKAHVKKEILGSCYAISVVICFLLQE